MKIVMDFRKFDGVIGGVEEGVIYITKYLTKKGHFVVILPKKSRLKEVQNIFKGCSNIKFVPLDTETHGISKKNARLDSTIIQDIAEKEKADLIHFPYNWSFPSKKKVPSVLTIHDVIPFTFREAMGFFTNKFFYKKKMKKSSKLNNAIVTVSEFSKKDISERVGVPLNKINVIPNGLRKPSPKNISLENKLRKKLGLKRFIINVGGIHERKNILRLIKAFSKLVENENYSGKLLITGSVSGSSYRIKMKRKCDRLVKKLQMKKRVVFTGFIPDEELDSLYRMSDFLVYPSMYEGFGIPIFEAMKLRVPVITSNITAMPEVAGKFAILVNPYDYKAIFSAMKKLLKDDKLREKMGKEGYKQTEDFTWERTSEMYLKVYEKVLKK